jgi:hypothetical protein
MGTWGSFLLWAFVVLSSSSALAWDEPAKIRILIRPRAHYSTIQRVARERFGPHADFYQLSSEQRAELIDKIDPINLGHVAIELPTIDRKARKTLGWLPEVPAQGDATEYEMALIRATEELKLPLITHDGPRSRTMPGHFHDDSEWARGSAEEPVFAVELRIEGKKLVKLWEAIHLLSSGGYNYQLHPDKPPGEKLFGYSRDSFNCVVAVEKLLQMSDIEPPFEFPRRGGMSAIVEIAKPFARPYVLETKETSTSYPQREPHPACNLQLRHLAQPTAVGMEG